MFLLISSLVIILFGFIFYELKHAKLTKAGNRIPGPPNLPILGNAQYFINIPIEDNLKILGEYIKKYGDTYRVWIGKELNIFFHNSEDLRVIMSGSAILNKASFYDVIKPWLNEGLLLNKGQKWYSRRKIITPAFHFIVLEQYTKIFEKQSMVLCEILKQRMELDDSFELYQLIKRYTLDVVSGQKWYSRRKIITPAFHFTILEEFTTIFEKQSRILCNNLKKLMELENSFELYQPVNRHTMDVLSGTKWFKRRKITTPAFHFKVLEQFIEVFDQGSRKLVDNLKTQIDKESFELYFFVNTCTLDVICESAMGVSVNAQTNTDSEYVKAVKTISTVLHKRMFDIFYRFDFTYWFTQLAREEKKALKILHGFTEKIIIQRREEILREKENATGQIDTQNDVGTKRKMAFLDILLQSEIDGKPLSNLDIREEVDTFMFEGHDTTSSAITFLFYNIARYPEAQKKCFQEILETFGKDKDKPVTYESLNNLHYTELCIKETLRLFPSVPLLGRRVTKECEINGKIIPAGANIGISPLHLGRMEEIFPNANEFIPERFDVVTNAEKMNPYAYIPFSAGPRNCIGQKFAMLEIKSVVANVLRNFEVEYVQSGAGEPLLIGELILRTRDPLMFRLKPRIYI